MKEWAGKVTQVTRTPWQDVILWSFKIETSERMFRMGKKEPDFKEGEWIAFSERNSNVNYGSIKVDAQQSTVTNGSDSVAPAPPAGGVVVVTGTVPPAATIGAAAPPETAPVTNVGERMQYQAARADAARIVVAALHTDHLPHATNVAKGKRLDLLVGYVKEVTKTLLDQENNNGTK